MAAADTSNGAASDFADDLLIALLREGDVLPEGRFEDLLRRWPRVRHPSESLAEFLVRCGVLPSTALAALGALRPERVLVGDQVLSIFSSDLRDLQLPDGLFPRTGGSSAMQASGLHPSQTAPAMSGVTSVIAGGSRGGRVFAPGSAAGAGSRSGPVPILPQGGPEAVADPARGATNPASRGPAGTSSASRVLRAMPAGPSSQSSASGDALPGHGSGTGQGWVAGSGTGTGALPLIAPGSGPGSTGTKVSPGSTGASVPRSDPGGGEAAVDGQFAVPALVLDGAVVVVPRAGAAWFVGRVGVRRRAPPLRRGRAGGGVPLDLPARRAGRGVGVLRGPRGQHPPPDHGPIRRHAGAGRLGGLGLRFGHFARHRPPGHARREHA